MVFLNFLRRQQTENFHGLSTSVGELENCVGHLIKLVDHLHIFLFFIFVFGSVCFGFFNQQLTELLRLLL